MLNCKSHADRLGIPRGVSGETVRKVLIVESNRVSCFCEETDITCLKGFKALGHSEYRRNDIPFTVFGLDQPDGNALYALYADQKGNNGASIKLQG